MPAVAAQDGGEQVAAQQHLAALLERIPGIAKRRAGENLADLERDEEGNCAPGVHSGRLA